MIKKINIYPTKTINILGVQISTPVLNISMNSEDILKCINQGALIDEILGKNITIRLSKDNYNKDNTHTSEPDNDDKIEISNWISSTLSDYIVENSTITGEGIKNYVKFKISEVIKKNFIDKISYDRTTKSLIYTKGTQSFPVPIKGFVTGITYDATRNTLIFDTNEETKINVKIPNNNYVTNGYYSSVNKTLALSLSDGTTVSIPMDKLLDEDSFKDSETISAVKNQDNSISLNLKLSAEQGNILMKKADGIYVNDTNHTKLERVQTNRQDEIIISNIDGTVKVSGIKIGKDTLSSTPNVQTVATEKAVSIEIEILTDELNNLILKQNVVNSTNISVEAPSQDKVISEEALISALQWKTL